MQREPISRERNERNGAALRSATVNSNKPRGWHFSCVVRSSRSDANVRWLPGGIIGGKLNEKNYCLCIRDFLPGPVILTFFIIYKIMKLLMDYSRVFFRPTEYIFRPWFDWCLLIFYGWVTCFQPDH